ncbi:hypothetical protein hrd7_21590 [Leptolinea sp. HRD-7]|nr:hypothetical protein hrd7_21590 [Leptolinea sp. HRD-7]
MSLIKKSGTKASNPLVSLLLIILAGLWLRLYYITRSDFVLNDGGMFYTMIIDLQKNNFVLPFFISFNHAKIPFVYPPLSFYLAAYVNEWLQIDHISILRFLPLFFNILSIPAFFFLAFEILRKKNQALLATAFYAIIPPGYEWLISGGGLTRSPAQLFFILSLYFYLAFINRQKKFRLFLSILFASMMMLHHLEYGVLTGISIALFSFPAMRFKTFVKTALVYATGVLLLTSPYWLTVLSRFGFSPMVSALSSGEFNPITSIAHLLSMSFTDEKLVTYVNVLAIIGLIYCLFSGRLRLVLWFLLIMFFSPRSVNRPLIFPVTIFASITVFSIILPALNRLDDRRTAQEGNTKRNLVPSYSSIFIAFSVLIPFCMGFLAPSGENSALEALSKPERAAMEWVKENTPEDSQFIVLDSAITWGADRSNEWFPVLSGRKSMTTVQGSEWLPDGQFDKNKKNYYELKSCMNKGTSCLEIWAGQYSLAYSHVYITKTDCMSNNGYCLIPLELSLRQSTNNKIIFENDSVLILKKMEK